MAFLDEAGLDRLWEHIANKYENILKVLSTEITDEVEAALVQAKASGEFDGESGVYIGTEPPTDEDVTVWIDPSGVVGGATGVFVPKPSSGNGTAGQFLVSDGVGGTMWLTVPNAEEVAY